MQKNGLRLVTAREGDAPHGATRLGVWGIGALLLLAGIVATYCGADEARRSLDPREVASLALEHALGTSSGDTEVRTKLVQLRTMVARRPLDSRARSVYASLLLSLSSNLSQLQAPVFYARLAVRFAPVTVPVVHLSALVLAHAREGDDAVALVCQMFGYDAKSAADLLKQIVSLLTTDQVEAAIPDTPRAWLTWADKLAQSGQREAGETWLVRAHQTWPNDIGVQGRMAERSVRLQDWSTLQSLFSGKQELPEVREAAIVFAYRALARSMTQDGVATKRDADTALRLGVRSIAVGMIVGQAYVNVGEYEAARRLWHRSLFELESRKTGGRRNLLLRLARLEHEHGEPAAALRLWRQVLEVDPENAEAQRRIRELTGSSF